MQARCLLLIIHLAAASDAAVDSIPRMRSELQAACARGECRKHSNTTEGSILSTTECHGRLTAYEFGLSLIPLRAPQIESFDALELESCGITRPANTPLPPIKLNVSSAGTTVFVDPAKGSDNNGSAAGGAKAPFATITGALAVLRKSPGPRTMILRGGVHYLQETLDLTPSDSGLTISGVPSGEEEAYISGGELLPELTWTKVTGDKHGAYVAELPASTTPVIAGLQTLEPHTRITRSRYPNGNPELCTDCWNDGAPKLWHKDLSCIGKARVVYKNLVDCNSQHELPDGTPCKNDSAMWDSYNTYSNGHGGCCSPWSGDASPYGPMGNYFCGNSSAGGWVGYDDPRQGNKAQGLSPALPVGFDFDPEQHPDIAEWTDPAGGVMHVWRAQGWFVNMFEIAKKEGNSVEFAKTAGGWVKGGWQGGRGWQVNHENINSTTDNYLLAGKWMIENVREALDAPNEYFYDVATHKLYMIPNATLHGQPAPPDPKIRLVAGKLQTLISINSTMSDPIKNVTIQGIKFRDAADTTMEPWGVPSGGDWGLYRGGAVFFEGTEGCVVKHCSFLRVDNNALFVSGYNRYTTFADNEFAWLGLSAMAGWGYTNEMDGTDGQQPRYTSIERNYVREIGIIEKQSSMWFQAKTCLTNIDSNVAFNQPRAAINFNDGFGGGTNASRNLLFNTCRETGDHGPINSWDRNAFISDVKYGYPSYTAEMNHVSHNMIIANYGASQGFDTDDGSSWYDIHDNFMFMADGWKMDYGGHDSAFHDNIVYVGDSDGQNCVNAGGFLAGHGVGWYKNKCVLTASKNIGSTGGCDCPGRGKPSPGLGVAPSTVCGLTMHDNEYFGDPKIPGNMTMSCAGPVLASTWLASGSDAGSAVYEIPDDDTLIGWAREKLDLPPLPAPPPPPPAPLPPQPPPTFPDTCIGHCWREGHCCANMVSGCNQPSCYQGCALAQVSTNLATCKAACAAAGGHCNYKLKNVTLQMCDQCASVTPPQECSKKGGCEGVASCQDGCANHFSPDTH